MTDTELGFEPLEDETGELALIDRLRAEHIADHPDESAFYDFFVGELAGTYFPEEKVELFPDFQGEDGRSRVVVEFSLDDDDWRAEFPHWEDTSPGRVALYHRGAARPSSGEIGDMAKMLRILFQSDLRHFLS